MRRRPVTGKDATPPERYRYDPADWPDGNAQHWYDARGRWADQHGRDPDRDPDSHPDVPFHPSDI